MALERQPAGGRNRHLTSDWIPTYMLFSRDKQALQKALRDQEEQRDGSVASPATEGVAGAFEQLTENRPALTAMISLMVIFLCLVAGVILLLTQS